VVKPVYTTNTDWRSREDEVVGTTDGWSLLSAVIVIIGFLSFHLFSSFSGQTGVH